MTTSPCHPHQQQGQQQQWQQQQQPATTTTSELINSFSNDNQCTTASGTDRQCWKQAKGALTPPPGIMSLGIVSPPGIVSPLMPATTTTPPPTTTAGCTTFVPFDNNNLETNKKVWLTNFNKLTNFNYWVNKIGEQQITLLLNPF